ncbi:arabinose ABC transporter permease [Sphingomonas sp. Leaf67]|uniref:MFS transporter n=1 Tax=Sphingomonas sp. Leaf67 TaxID=1736230 RepID=UPI000700E27B|nr:MFS transporter [Sphingomonas sp. Leaf67]KQN91939.1 arabinose ABC transporter permease [Sphingomonas sp. Leaf67]
MAEAFVHSQEIEADARAVNASPNGEAQISVQSEEIAIGVIIGRTSEFFDFFVYAIASVIVFPQLVFPFVDRLTGTLYSFALFPLAFFARPFGTLLFMWVDRRHGRGTKLTMALFLLGTATVAMGFLPGYAAVGVWSAILLSALRILQGIALGGAWDGLASLLALNVPQDRRGWYAMIPQLGAPLGLMVASALFAFFTAYMSAEDFISWGWRYPFFVAFALNVVALFARLRIVVTPEYTALFENRELKASPVLPTVAREWKTIVIGALVPLASFALFHMVTVFPLSWILLFTEQEIARFLWIETACAVFFIFAIIISGVLADHIGRRTLLGIGAVAIALFSGLAPLLLNGGDAGEIAFMITGFILLGLSFGQSSGTVAANFAKDSRYTGAALTSDLAWLFGAGFAPLVALALADKLGLIASGLYLLSGAVGTLAALALNKELARRLD